MSVESTRKRKGSHASDVSAKERSTYKATDSSQRTNFASVGELGPVPAVVSIQATMTGITQPTNSAWLPLPTSPGLSPNFGAGLDACDIVESNKVNPGSEILACGGTMTHLSTVIEDDLAWNAFLGNVFDDQSTPLAQNSQSHLAWLGNNYPDGMESFSVTSEVETSVGRDVPPPKTDDRVALVIPQ